MDVPLLAIVAGGRDCVSDSRCRPLTAHVVPLFAAS